MRSLREAVVRVVLALLVSLAAAGTAAAQSLQWARTWRGPVNEMGTGIAVNPGDDGVYVAGFRWAGGDKPPLGLMRKLDAAGAPIWAKALPFEPGRVALSRDGDIYVAGTRTTASGGTIGVLRKVHANGASPWQRDLPSSGGTGSSTASGVVVNPAGTFVWVAGSERTAAGWECRLAKYSAAGEHLWSGRYRAPVGDQCVAQGVDLDREGSVYVAGYAATLTSDGVSHNASRSLVAKFSRGGVLLWARLPPAAEGFDYAGDIAMGPDGEAYVAGHRRTANDSDGFLWKLASDDGRVLWRRVVATAGHDSLIGVAVRPGGSDICAAGALDQLSDACSAVVACYSPEGARLWQQTYPGPAAGKAFGMSVALTRAGSTYIAGAVFDDVSWLDLWVAQYR